VVPVRGSPRTTSGRSIRDSASSECCLWKSTTRRRVPQGVDDLTVEVRSPGGLDVGRGLDGLDEDGESVAPGARTEIIEACALRRLLDEAVDDA
jgi:hypothetical protein